MQNQLKRRTGKRGKKEEKKEKGRGGGITDVPLKEKLKCTPQKLFSFRAVLLPRHKHTVWINNEADWASVWGECTSLLAMCSTRMNKPLLCITISLSLSPLPPLCIWPKHLASYINKLLSLACLINQCNPWTHWAPSHWGSLEDYQNSGIWAF